jgi:ABC-type dipeptide/oligopeptide/nickel transport system ATPase component
MTPSRIPPPPFLPMSTGNVILFGESGCGKSSIINMLLDDENAADVSSGATGCTFKSQSFEVNVRGVPLTIWDTVGLNEGDAGRVPGSDAILKLYQLILELSTGVSLLVFVMRAPRIKSSVPQNWKLFHEVICQSKVPIVIVITGLENSKDMDGWWCDNKGEFQKYGIRPDGVACITAIRGKELLDKGYMYDREFEASREKVRNLIGSVHLVVPWKATPLEWFKIVVREVVERKGGCFGAREVTRKEYVRVFGEAASQLRTVCRMSKNDVHEVTKRLQGK